MGARLIWSPSPGSNAGDDGGAYDWGSAGRRGGGVRLSQCSPKPAAGRQVPRTPAQRQLQTQPRRQPLRRQGQRARWPGIHGATRMAPRPQWRPNGHKRKRGMPQMIAWRPRQSGCAAGCARPPAAPAHHSGPAGRPAIPPPMRSSWGRHSHGGGRTQPAAAMQLCTNPARGWRLGWRGMTALKRAGWPVMREVVGQ